MAEEDEMQAVWLSVIGRSLAYLCMKSAERDSKFQSTLERVAFLEGLGLPTGDAAKAAGSTKASVDELRRRLARKGGKNGKTKKKSHR